MILRNTSNRPIVLKATGGTTYTVTAFGDLSIAESLWTDSIFRASLRLRERDLVITAGARGSGASVTVGTASVAVAHNLSVTPSVVFITPTADPQQRYWISAKSSSTFTITLAANAATNPVTFDWQAYV